MFSIFNRKKLSAIPKESSKTQWLDIRDGLSSSYLKAVKEYSSESRFPFKKSKMGIEFKWNDFITFHTNNDKKAQVTELKKMLNEHLIDNDDKEIINTIAIYLNKFGSSWGGPEHSLNNFSNYFLQCLRYENVHAFRLIVGKAFGVKFIEESCTLFRRDTRNYKIVFAQGFELIQSSNLPKIPKKNYYQSITYSTGISTSFKIPPRCYGRSDMDAYFIIKYEVNHNALLIDINGSPCNQGSQRDVEEVNVVDSIPTQNIDSFVIVNKSRCSKLTFLFSCGIFKQITSFTNPNFQPEYSTIKNLHTVAKPK